VLLKSTLREQHLQQPNKWLCKPDSQLTPEQLRLKVAAYSLLVQRLRNKCKNTAATATRRLNTLKETTDILTAMDSCGVLRNCCRAQRAWEGECCRASCLFAVALPVCTAASKLLALPGGHGSCFSAGAIRLQAPY
jgi:hypothetical protein